MKRSDFRGTSQVFKFTVAQHYKSKATLVSLIIIFVFTLFSIPFMNSIAGNQVESFVSYNIKELYLNNLTSYNIDPLTLAIFDKNYQGIEVINVNIEPKEDIFDAVYMSVAPGDYGCAVEAKALAPDSISETEIYTLCATVEQVIKKQLLEANGVTDEQLSILNASVNLNTDHLSNMSGGDTKSSEDGYFLVSYVLSILIMMLTLFSSISIIQSVVEEKSSKLVELLMVSIEPLALILGKILAVMCFIFSGMIFIGMGLGLSSILSAKLFGINLSQASVGMYVDVLTKTSVSDVIVFIISLVLGYLTFSIISGLSGARCSNMEDAGSANLLVTLIVMGCYFAAIIQSAIDSSTVSIFTALCPMISVFCAPASYICGRIELWVLILSWLVQAAVILVIARLSAKVYRNLIIYNGNPIKFKAIFRMAKEAKV